MPNHERIIAADALPPLSEVTIAGQGIQEDTRR
jgi:hypothetical protein